MSQTFESGFTRFSKYTLYIREGAKFMNSPLLWINLVAFLVILAYTINLVVYLISSRIKFIKLGKKTEFDNNVKERLGQIITYVFGQKKLLKDKNSGWMHVFIFYGFIVVQLGAIDFIIKGIYPSFHLADLLGPVYHFFTISQEFFTVLILFAMLWAFYRRYVEKLPRLKRGLKNGLVIIFISLLMLAVMFGNGMSIIWHGYETSSWEPIASAIATIFGGISPTAAIVGFYIAWWVHTLVLCIFLIYIPQGKHAHLIGAPANVYLNNYKRPVQLEKINFEDETQETFGVGKIEEYTQLQLVDLYACVECGRCTDMCPANGTGKKLSPREIILNLRDHLTFTGAVTTKSKPWVPTFLFNNTKGNQLAVAAQAAGDGDVSEVYSPSLIGDVITEEEIWACTTCRNCEDQCPVMNRHVQKIIDLRRYLVLTEGKMEPDAQRAIQNIERQSNPWGINRKQKEDWRALRDDVEIPTVKEMKKSGEEFEYLFWVGSMGSYDNRSQKVALSFAKLLNEAGVKFAILGNKEKNSGDTPRRLGNEYLYQDLVTENISEFEKNEAKKIVTIDPHAFNTFKNEYPDFGLEAEVYHHTEVLAQLVKEGRLKPTHEVNETIVWHDSCYLGRYNEVYEAPRSILKAIPGVKLVEMQRHHDKAMCCGAGGGLMWLEEKVGIRINVARTEQAIETDPTVIGAGCPYCLTMLIDGTKAKELENQIQTLDISEILERSVLGVQKPTDEVAV